jgi:glutathione S-transferase
MEEINFRLCYVYPLVFRVALTDDNDVLVFESGAILQYIYLKSAADKDSARRRAGIISWIQWANASLDPICFLETPDGKV